MTDEFESEREDFDAWIAANAPRSDRNARGLAWRAWCAALGTPNSVPKTAAERADVNAERGKINREEAAKLRAELETARAQAAVAAEAAAEERAKLKAVADAGLQEKADAEEKAHVEADEEKDAEMERMREDLAALHAASGAFTRGKRDR